MKFYPTDHSDKRNPVDANAFDAFDEWFRPFFRGSNTPMQTDVRTENGNYVMEIDMPGFKKSDIDVDFDDGYLTVRAQHAEKTEEKQGYLRRERVGSCSRSFYVGEIDEDAISAKYEDGTLTLTFPKEKEKSEKKRIEIL